MHVRAPAAMVALSLLVAPRAEAQTVHLYGPDGSPTERRVFGVVRTEGGCAPARGLAWSAAEPGAALEVEAASGCVSSIRIRASTPLETVTLRARGSALTAEAPVRMGRTLTPGLRAERRGATVWVAGGAAEARGSLHGSSGARPLRPARRGLRGEAPDELTVVIVRGDDRVGVGVLPPSTPEAALRVVPTGQAVPADGVPRAAAVVVVTDTAGRLSRAVPLQITSDRGRLRGLEWIAPGVASVTLSTTSPEPTLDLRVEAPGRDVVAVEIPIVRGWPLEGTITLPDAMTSGAPFSVAVSAQAAGGGALRADQLRLVCGDAAAPVSGVGHASCAADGTEVAVSLEARVDDAWVPIAARRAALSPAPEAGSGVRLRAHARGGIDGWAQAVLGGGVGVEVRALPWLGLGGDVRYAAILTDVGVGSGGQATLRGVDHVVDVGLAAHLRPVGPLVVGATGGLETSVFAGEVDGVSNRAVDLRPYGELSVGVDADLGGGRFGARAGVWLGAERLRAEAWGASPVRGFVEVVGDLAL